MKQIATLLLATIAGNLFIGFAQSNNTSLDKELSAIQKASNLPGFAIGIIKKDTLLFSKGYGFANIPSKTLYSPQTIQPVGSVSKTVIAVALLKATELDYFNLETDINTVLPFKVMNPRFPNSIITIRQLATHTSSLVDNDTTYIKAYNLGKKPTIPLSNFLKEYYTPGGTLYSTANFDTAVIGSTYRYSNIAAALAAYLIEVKAGMSFEFFTTKYIFEPLKMNDTHWFFDENKSKQYATLYEVNKQEIPLYKVLLNKDGSLKPYSCSTYPDGSLRTSVSDLTKYMLAMMKGYFGEAGIVSKESFALLFAKQFNAQNMPANMDKKEVNRAIFWSYTPKGLIRHTGSDAGVMAFISFDPVKKIGRVFTLNAQLDGEDNIKTVKSFMAIIEALNKYEEKL
jgi:CubicO group peptidase (beta-lactamase class C family)